MKPDLTEEYLAAQLRRIRARCNRESQHLEDRARREELPSYLLDPLSCLQAYRELQRLVHVRWRGQAVAGLFTHPSQTYLGPLMNQAVSDGSFLQGYLTFWREQPPGDPRRQAVLHWWQQGGEDPVKAVSQALACCPADHPEEEQTALRRLSQRQKQIARQVGGSPDRERLALVDGLKKGSLSPLPSLKAGIVPTLACRQSCRHCLFAWRPTLKGQARPPEEILQAASRFAPHLLFSGGEAERHIDLFLQAVATLPAVTTFAIILNGTLGKCEEEVVSFYRNCLEALNQRPRKARPAGLLLQFSCDAFHQEIYPTPPEGRLQERIPIAWIANCLTSVPADPRIQVALLHRLERLNFSEAVFREGVLGRLQRELRERNRAMYWISQSRSSLARRDPARPDRIGYPFQQGQFRLTDHPRQLPFFWMSAQVDGMGRAERLDPVELLPNSLELEAYLERGIPPRDPFEVDVMVRMDGQVVLGGATHITLGQLGEERLETIAARRDKDPLIRALAGFDPSLPRLYQECAGDLDAVARTATSPHHLLHRLTESAEVRLHLTRRLLKENPLHFQEVTKTQTINF
ncbi:MAG: radical SAM protein [Magnetococcales bacterium]|nr:radical SAM protein [Magnetococcales bacterium]